MQLNLRLSASALAELRSNAEVTIDTAAETARLQWLTQGTGQALEYADTQTQAAAAMTSPDPLDPALYPMIVAEQQAQAAVGVMITLRQTVQIISAQSAAWQSAGATIKQIRRTAKLKIASATTSAQIDLIVSELSWPTP
jgi:hypothetical protein